MSTPDHAVTARHLICNAIFALGAAPVRRPVIHGNPASGTMLQPEPLAGIRAAMALGHAARRAVSDCARYGREDGLTWTQIGAAMVPAHDEYSAFLAVASELGRGPSFAWTCGSCGQVVTDSGPEAGGHPEDQEQRHSETCERFVAAIVAHEAQLEADDDD
jgi:hypothetical protein